MKTYEETLKYRIEKKGDNIKQNALALKKDLSLLISKLDAGYYNGINGLENMTLQGNSIDKECAELRMMLVTLTEVTTLNEKNKEGN